MRSGASQGLRSDTALWSLWTQRSLSRGSWGLMADGSLSQTWLSRDGYAKMGAPLQLVLCRWYPNSRYLGKLRLPVFLLYLLLLMTSGDIQKGVPMTESLSAKVYISYAETPKSVSLEFPLWSNRMLPPLISLDKKCTYEFFYFRVSIPVLLEYYRR